MFFALPTTHGCRGNCLYGLTDSLQRGRIVVFQELLDLGVKVLWQAATYRARNACFTCRPNKCARVGLVQVAVFFKMRWGIILDQ